LDESNDLAHGFSAIEIIYNFNLAALGNNGKLKRGHSTFVNYFLFH